MNAAITNFIKPLLPAAMRELEKTDGLITGKLEAVELTDGEAYAAYVVVSNTSGKVFLVLCAFDSEDRITRQIETQRLKDFLDGIVKEIL